MAEDSRSLSQQRYTRFARRYVESPAHAQGDDLEQMLALARPESGWTALDIATGGGHTALKFSTHVSKVVASDLTPNMLLEARSFAQMKGAANLAFLATDAEAISFPDRMFDLVTCRIAPHHFPDCRKFVLEASRVLKPNGLLLIEDHMLPEDNRSGKYIDGFERLRDPSHNRAFSKSQWIGMVEKAGLRVEQVETISKRHEFKAWVERQSCSQQVITELIEKVIQAPPIVQDWLQPLDFPSKTASFNHVFILIAGRKPPLL